MSDIREDILNGIVGFKTQPDSFIFQESVYQAMQEYADKVAKERVIEFGLWIKTLGTDIINKNTSTQLYYKFIKETNI